MKKVFLFLSILAGCGALKATLTQDEVRGYIDSRHGELELGAYLRPSKDLAEKFETNFFIAKLNFDVISIHNLPQNITKDFETLQALVAKAFGVQNGINLKKNIETKIQFAGGTQGFGPGSAGGTKGAAVQMVRSAVVDIIALLIVMKYELYAVYYHQRAGIEEYLRVLREAIDALFVDAAEIARVKEVADYFPSVAPTGLAALTQSSKHKLDLYWTRDPVTGVRLTEKPVAALPASAFVGEEERGLGSIIEDVVTGQPGSGAQEVATVVEGPVGQTTVADVSATIAEDGGQCGYVRGIAYCGAALIGALAAYKYFGK